MYKNGVNQSGIPSSAVKQLPIIPLSNVQNFSKKNTTVYYGNSLKTETNKNTQLKTQPKLQSQYKESTPSFPGVASS